MDNKPRKWDMAILNKEAARVLLVLTSKCLGRKGDRDDATRSVVSSEREVEPRRTKGKGIAAEGGKASSAILDIWHSYAHFLITPT
jgi:hypothetical protein